MKNINIGIVDYYGNGYNDNDDINLQDYKYIAYIKESDSSYADIYVSNNFNELKSFVYNIVRQGYTSGSGTIYYMSDEYQEYTLYEVWYSPKGGLNINNFKK